MDRTRTVSMTHSFYYTRLQLEWVELHYTNIRILAEILSEQGDGYVVLVSADAPEDLLLYMI
jgi:hypothetical protein